MQASPQSGGWARFRRVRDSFRVLTLPLGRGASTLPRVKSRHIAARRMGDGRRSLPAAAGAWAFSHGRKPSLFYTSPQFRSSTARRSHRPLLQAEGLLDNSRWQVRLRRTPPPDRVDPKLVRPCRGRRHFQDGCSTLSGSVRWLRVRSRGRRSPTAHLPTATICQPFRLEPDAVGKTSRQRPPNTAGFV